MTYDPSLEPAVMPTYGRYPLQLVRGEGMRVWDDEGREYLDFAGGLATMPLGHSHPVWLEAVTSQAATLTMVSNLYFTEPQARLAQRLVDLLAIGEDAQVFFANSGAEANEAALKIVRKWGLASGRSRIVALENSFHGRTASTLAATGQPSKRKAFEPLVDWFDFVPAGDLVAMDAAIGGATAAVLLEPVLGEGGVLPLSHEYLQGVRSLTADRGALLVVDEVQTGTGRCGAWRATSLSGIRPDVMTLAKGLGGGLPIGACIARGELSFAPGDHASTFGGGPVVCAGALAVLGVIETDGLLDNASKQGERLVDGLREALSGNPLFAESRGRGLLVGVGLARPVAKDVVLELMANGMLATEASPGVVRLSPPLIASDADVDAAADRVAAAITKVAEGAAS